LRSSHPHHRSSRPAKRPHDPLKSLSFPPPRVKAARSALRHFKTEAREAGKLLEDKKALETKLKEMEGTLELVQGQRNELRQEVKDAKAALADAERRMQVDGWDRLGG
jgi:hypothetical protein